MPIARTAHLIVAALAAVQFTATSTMAHAQEADIQTIYATEKGACGGGLDTKVEISKGRIVGPGFDCTLSTGRPAGTGLVAYEANCSVDGKKTLKGLSLDLGNYEDHFELALPGREDWVKLYPCTPVPGLKKARSR